MSLPIDAPIAGSGFRSPRTDVNSTAPPSGVNDGWLSYPGLFEMLIGAVSVTVSFSTFSDARYTSVAGGGC